MMKIVLEKDNNLTVSISDELTMEEIAYCLNTLTYQLLKRFPEKGSLVMESVAQAYAANGQGNVVFLDAAHDSDKFQPMVSGRRTNNIEATLETMAYLDLNIVSTALEMVDNIAEAVTDEASNNH